MVDDLKAKRERLHALCLGNDMRQGVTLAGHAILDRADETRDHLAAVDLESLLRMATKSADATRGGDLESRRAHCVTAAAFMVIAVEKLDEELRS